jgi:hypothetical protein
MWRKRSFPKSSRDSVVQVRRRDDRPAKLPSQKALEGVLDGLAATLFPNRLGLPDLTNQGVDYFVGNTLDLTLRELLEQIRRCCALSPTSIAAGQVKGQLLASPPNEGILARMRRGGGPY